MSVDETLEEFRAAAGDDLLTLLMWASRATNAAVLQELDPHGESGVRITHMPVIAALEPGGSRLVDVAKKIGVTRQATAALVRDLEAAGIVLTTPDPHDGRATLVILTERGAEFCRRAIELMAAREKAVADDLGAEELAALKSSLRRLGQS